MKQLFLLATTLFLAFCNIQAQTFKENLRQADSLKSIGKAQEAIVFYKKALTFFEPTSEDYAKTRNNIGTCMIRSNNDSTEAYLLENLKICTPFASKKGCYPYSLYNLGLFYHPHYKGNNAAKSEEYFKRNVEARKALSGTKNEPYATALSNLANLYIVTNEYDKAIALLNESTQLRKELLGEKHPDYAASLNNLAIIYMYNGQYKESERLYLISAAIRKETLGKFSTEYAESLNNLGALYADLSNYTATEALYKEVAQIWKNHYGEYSQDYAIILNNLSSLYFSMGNYVASEPMARQTLNIREKILGKKHLEYGTTLTLMALLNKQLGDYQAAEKLQKEALVISKESAGERTRDHIEEINNLSGIYLVSKQYKEAEQSLNHAKKLTEEVFGKKHLSYAYILNNLALLSLYQNKFLQADSLARECLKIEQEHKATSFHVYNTLGAIHTNMQHYKTADEFFKQALAEIASEGGKNNLNYYRNKQDMAMMYWQQRNIQATKSTFLEMLEGYEKYLRKMFPLMSEAERGKLYEDKIKVAFETFSSYAAQHKMASELYDLQLFSKSILLSASQKIRQRIINSGDTTLVKQYQDWTSLKFSLAKYMQMSTEEFNKTGLRLDSLQKLANTLEKNLSQQSESFAKLTENKKLTWQAIQSQLKPQEAAIEIVRVRKYGVQNFATDSSKKVLKKYPIYGLTDTIQYVVLILTKTSKKPEIFIIKNGNELEGKFFKSYQNMIKYQFDTEEAYDEYWAAISKKLSNLKKIYLSPDGIYNQININTLKNANTGKFVLEEIEIHTVTNTKDLLSFGLKHNNKKSGSLFGNPTYDTEPENRKEYKKTKVRSFLNLEEGVTPLPSTIDEIKNISEYLQKAAYQTQTYTEQEASEAQFKQIKNPKILHVATHGFFVSSSNATAEINPMLRSGLLLTGVSNYARAEEKPNSEDGILTALEASNLSLDETDLVVLSACETGLGDVKAGEGVYGLQRAFKVAGAKTIVMSLWKVDDAVTQKLMTAFYENYAQTNNARQAFKTAQAQIKAQYPQPYFWGAFVMVGE